MSIMNLLSNTGYIICNKDIARKLGIHASIILGELCSKHAYWDSQGKLENGMFYVTREDIEEDTCLSPHYQRDAIKLLESKNIISVKKKGVPAKNYYKINEQAIYDLLLTTLTTRNESGEPLDDNAVNVTNKETNKETNKDYKRGDKQAKIPTLDEVRAYCKERNNKVDPNQWHDHYEAVGWKVGKNPMKNWKAAVRTWERNCPKEDSGGYKNL